MWVWPQSFPSGVYPLSFIIYNNLHLWLSSFPFESGVHTYLISARRPTVYIRQTRKWSLDGP